jgi:hypothetical protein
VEHTDENIDWATSEILQFLHLRNAPTDERVIRAHAKAWLDIFHDRERGQMAIQKAVATFDSRYPNPIAIRRVYTAIGQKAADGKYADKLETDAETGGLV